MRGNDMTLCSGQGQLLLILPLLSHCKHMGSRHRKFSFVRTTYLRINAMVFGIAVVMQEGSEVLCAFIVVTGKTLELSTFLLM